MSRCESPLGQPCSLSVLVSFPVAMIEYSDKISLRQKVYPSPWGQISVLHRREIKASGVQSKWLGEQRTHVCVFGSLSRLSKGFIFFLFMCMCVCINSWRPEMQLEVQVPASCLSQVLGAELRSSARSARGLNTCSVDVRVLGSTSQLTAS